MCSVRRQTTTRDHAVDVRVMDERLPPGVQYGDETDLGAEVFGIGGDRFEGVGRGGK